MSEHLTRGQIIEQADAAIATAYSAAPRNQAFTWADEAAAALPVITRAITDRVRAGLAGCPCGSDDCLSQNAPIFRLLNAIDAEMGVEQ